MTGGMQSPTRCVLLRYLKWTIWGSIFLTTFFEPSHSLAGHDDDEGAPRKWGKSWRDICRVDDLMKWWISHVMQSGEQPAM
jgi:hypothetical protein